jgi:hypothetical protein
MKKSNVTKEIIAQEDAAQVINTITQIEEKIMNQESTSNAPVESPVVESPVVEPAPTTIEDLWARIDARLRIIEEKLTPPMRTQSLNSRGLQSTRSMTEEDATRIMTGDLKDKAIKAAAIELGLSYGQIYSARNGYTFKTQYAAKIAAEKK